MNEELYQEEELEQEPGWVYCEECGNRFSEEEDECPYCAVDRQIKQGGKKQHAGLRALLTVVLVAGGLLLGYRAVTSEEGFAFGARPSAISSEDTTVNPGMSVGVVGEESAITESPAEGEDEYNGFAGGDSQDNGDNGDEDSEGSGEG